MSLVLFALVYPLAAFLMSLKHIGKKEFHYVFILLAVLFGLVIKIEADDIFNGDITRYVLHIEEYKTMSWNDIFSGADYGVILLTRIFLLITSNPRVIVIGYYLVFAFFLSKSLRIVFQNAHISNDFKFYFYSITTILVIPLTYLNALRFALATVFYIWCILEIFIRRKRIFYGIIFIAPLIHFSFWAFAFLPVLHLLLKSRIRVVWAIFVISAVMNTMSGTAFNINTYSSALFNDDTNAHISAYASEDGLATMNERYASIARESNVNRIISEVVFNVRNNGVMWLLFLMSVLGYRTFKNNKQYESMMTLLLLAFSMTNILSSASNGDRFFTVSIAITIYILYILMGKSSDEYGNIQGNLAKYKFYINAIFLLTVLNTLLTLYMDRKGFDYIHILIGNFITPYLY